MLPPPRSPADGRLDSLPRNGYISQTAEKKSAHPNTYLAWQAEYILLKDKERDLIRAKSHAKGAKILATTKGIEGAAPSRLFAKAAMFAEEAEDLLLAADYRMAQADHLQMEGDESGDLQTLNEAVMLYDRLLSSNLPEDRAAAAAHQLGGALYKIYKLKGDADDLRKCVEILTNAGDLYTKTATDPEILAALMLVKGQAVRAQAEIRESSLLFIEAARCFEKRAEFMQTYKAPVKDQAEALNLAGVCYAKAACEEQGSESLKKAVKRFEDALRRLGTGSAYLKGKSTIQNNLGYALLKMSQRVSDSSLLRKAASAFESAMEEENEGVSPVTAAATRFNLGATLLQIGETEQGIHNLLEAEAELKAIPSRHYASNPMIKERVTQMKEMIAQALHDAHGKG